MRHEVSDRHSPDQDKRDRLRPQPNNHCDSTEKLQCPGHAWERRRLDRFSAQKAKQFLQSMLHEQEPCNDTQKIQRNGLEFPYRSCPH